MALLNRWTSMFVAGLLAPGAAAANPAPARAAIGSAPAAAATASADRDPATTAPTDPTASAPAEAAGAPGDSAAAATAPADPSLAATAPATAQPFAPGEQLAYELKLLGIRAGEANFEVEADALEPETLRFIARGRSLGAADSIFRLRQTAECVVERDTLALRVCRVATKQRTGDRRREFVVDRGERRVRERRLQDGKPKEKVVEFGDGIDRVQEALSGLYLLRSQLPQAGTPLRFQAVRKDKPITVQASSGEVATVETPAGKFEAVEVKLQVIKGDAEEGETAGSLWITTDARRLPVKLAFDAKVGTLEAYLTGAKGTLAAAPAPAPGALQARANPAKSGERR